MERLEDGYGYIVNYRLPKFNLLTPLHRFKEDKFTYYKIVRNLFCVNFRITKENEDHAFLLNIIEAVYSYLEFDFIII